MIGTVDWYWSPWIIGAGAIVVLLGLGWLIGSIESLKGQMRRLREDSGMNEKLYRTHRRIDRMADLLVRARQEAVNAQAKADAAVAQLARYHRDIMGWNAGIEKLLRDMGEDNEEPAPVLQAEAKQEA